ncbi:MAG: PTS IIA-like nitrogen-regulatory protein PtsN [Proteobacteria bacterium]|nr:MAG: PTS IIA-like nitrogen-regulatory protein PtsN [Pseudomonadota bacterium]QKK11877.1 MAG: PTS IIA-like nitrogen regulatory protein PtsN [Pseudomonadota bacterium]
MTISDLLSPERVVPKADITSKKRALEYLSTLITESCPDLDQAEIFSSLLSREKLGSTGLGNRVALPHGRIAHDRPAVGAFVTAAVPVDFDAIDDQPVDLLFALVVPEESTDEHLQILAQLAEMFRDADFCERLRQTSDPAELLQLLSAWRTADSSVT